MKLTEALTILQAPSSSEAKALRVFLVCGFEPLHLATFLAAHLRRSCPEHRISIESGVYGDWLGNLERLKKAPADSAALVLEWPDLDPRLGIRQLGGWGARVLDDILETATARLSQIREGLEAVAKRTPVALCLPTLPLPPVGHTCGGQASVFELRLRERLQVFASSAAQQSGAKFVNPQRLDCVSPWAERLDVKSELLAGFPYRVRHASLIGELLARLIQPQPPKKGLITDLDDTLWHGLLGEVGVNGVHWDLEHSSQPHGLYQQLLRSLAEGGIMIAAASKNDAALVEEAMQRRDLVLSANHIYPVEAHWKPKSESVGRILRAWNVAADSVVFVDDNPAELAEVQAVYPELECFLYPKSDPQAVYDLLHHLRDRFGKEILREEDNLRAESIRRNRQFMEDAVQGGADTDRFLQQIEAELTLSLNKDPLDARSLELINKTNQFNLNGRRYSETEWRAYLMDPRTVQLRAAYKDKFGPLGKIAVLTGYVEQKLLTVENWVMSCRAFSRRIEHRCLDQLFREFDLDAIGFDFQHTPRNGPLREFFANLSLGSLEPGFQISKESWAQVCPPLYHRIERMPYV